MDHLTHPNARERVPLNLEGPEKNWALPALALSWKKKISQVTILLTKKGFKIILGDIW